MSDETSAPEVDASPAPVVVNDNSTAPFDNASKAAEAYVAALSKKESPVEQPAPVENELSDEDNGAPAKVPAEEPEEAQPEELPPLEPPRSWTQAEKERFQSLPRETQEYLSSREQEREREFRRGQNEIAEQRNAVKAEREAAEKVRLQYEAQLPALMQSLQDAQQNAFADIRNVDDVTRLANEDPFRYLQWQAHQTKLQAVNAENERAKGDKTKAQQAEWQNFVNKQNELAVEYIPELADKTKASALMNRAGERLKDLGFKPDELDGFTKGEKISPYDYRFQRLLVNDLKLADIQSAKTAAAKPNLPPVQRPGVAKASTASVSEREQALNDTFNRTGSLKVAQELYALQSSKRRAS